MSYMFLMGVPAKLKVLLDRWTQTRAENLDAVKTRVDAQIPDGTATKINKIPTIETNLATVDTVVDGIAVAVGNVNTAVGTKVSTTRIEEINTALTNNLNTRLTYSDAIVIRDNIKSGVEAKVTAEVLAAKNTITGKVDLLELETNALARYNALSNAATSNWNKTVEVYNRQKVIKSYGWLYNTAVNNITFPPGVGIVYLTMMGGGGGGGGGTSNTYSNTYRSSGGGGGAGGAVFRFPLYIPLVYGSGEGAYGAINVAPGSGGGGGGGITSTEYNPNDRSAGGGGNGSPSTVTVHGWQSFRVEGGGGGGPGRMGAYYHQPINGGGGGGGATLGHFETGWVGVGGMFLTGQGGDAGTNSGSNATGGRGGITIMGQGDGGYNCGWGTVNAAGSPGRGYGAGGAGGGGNSAGGAGYQGFVLLEF